MGWLDTPDLCYTDAVTVLAAATHRPVRVVLHRGRRVVRVDFEFGRFLLAQNHDTGTTTDPDACGDWTVTVYDEQEPSAGVLAEATDEWLADAFDRVYDVARAVPGRQLAASAADAATVAAPSVTVPSAGAVALC